MAGSGEVDRAVSESGERDLLPSLHSMDDPCTEHLRLCRLFAYLRGHGYGELYLAARRLMPPVIFHPEDLAKKIKEREWMDATMYVNSFAPFSGSGYEARLLTQFLMDFMALDSFVRTGYQVRGSYFWNWFESMYKTPAVLSKYPCFATLVEDIVSKRDGNASYHCRASWDWQLVRNKAAEVAEEMAYKAPELRRRMRCYRRCRSDLHHVVPVVGPRRRVKKSSGTKQPAALAHYFLKMKKRLPSSTSQGTNHNDPTAEFKMLKGESLQKMLHGEPLLALFETCLEAGTHSVVKDGRPPHLPKEGVPFGCTKAACTFSVTLTPRSGPRLQPKPSFELALKRAILEASQRARGVTLPSSLGHQPDLSSGTAGMKRAILQVPRQDTAHPGNPSKKPARSTGNDPSPSFEASHPLIRNEGTK